MSSLDAKTLQAELDLAIREIAETREQLAVARLMANTEADTRIMAERELHAAQERLSVAAEAARLSTWEWDIGTGMITLDERFGTVIDDPAFEAATVTLKSLFERVHEGDRLAWEQQIDAVRRGERVRLQTVFRFKTFSGWLWLESTGLVTGTDPMGRPTRMIGANMNINALKNAQAAFSVAEDRYRQVVMNLSDTVFQLDGDSKLSFLNPAFRNLTGIEPAKALGTLLTDWIDPSTLAGFELAWNRMLRDPANSCDVEFRLFVTGKLGRWVMCHARPVRVEGQSALLTMGVLADVTDRREKAGQLLEKQRQSEARNIEKSAFMVQIAREIQRPLRSILQASDRIAVAALDEAQTGELRRLRRDAQTMLLLFNDLTDLSRLDAGQLVVNAQSFELRAWMDETVARWREPVQRRGLTIDANVDARVPPFLVCDARHLRHILDHLVSNAMRFTTKGEIKINCFFTAANLVFTVRDTGAGIPKDQLPTIFDTPYAVGDEPQVRTEGSTGLGLAICRKLAELLGGTLTVQSELGKGSSFALRVPVQLSATTILQA